MPLTSTNRLAPGLALTGAAAAAAHAVHWSVPAAGPVVIAVALGVVIANTTGLHPAFLPGLRMAGRRVLRWGVVLLGFTVALPGIAALGVGPLAVVAAGVGVTFGFTMWLGARLGVGPERSLLVATGVSICGASAVAAMNTVAKGDEEDAASAVAGVTLFGSAAIGIYPLVQATLGLPDVVYGGWAGASVHEVGQVAAIGTAAGTAVAGPAILAKLSRVLMLAPLVAGVSLILRRGARDRPPLVPLFVAGFLAAVGLRSTGLVPPVAVAAASQTSTILLTAAMFALGTGVNVRRLIRGGGPTLLLGLIATLLLGGFSLVGLAVVDA